MTALSLKAHVTTHRLRAQLARDIIADAVETGTIRYWAWTNSLNAPQDVADHGLVITDHGGEDEPQHLCPTCLGTGRRTTSPGTCTQCRGNGAVGVTVNTATVEWVLEQIVAGNVGKFFNSGYSATLAERLRPAAAAGWTYEAVSDVDYDAEDADCVLQLAALGEIVYS